MCGLVHPSPHHRAGGAPRGGEGGQGETFADMEGGPATTTMQAMGALHAETSLPTYVGVQAHRGAHASWPEGVCGASGGSGQR